MPGTCSVSTHALSRSLRAPRRRRASAQDVRHPDGAMRASACGKRSSKRRPCPCRSSRASAQSRAESRPVDLQRFCDIGRTSTHRPGGSRRAEPGSAALASLAALQPGVRAKHCPPGLRTTRNAPEGRGPSVIGALRGSSQAGRLPAGGAGLRRPRASERTRLSGSVLLALSFPAAHAQPRARNGACRGRLRHA